MMGTRSGSVDPGILIYLLQHKGLDVNALDKALNYESGLLGISGISSDLRQILSELPHNPEVVEIVVVEGDDAAEGNADGLPKHGQDVGPVQQDGPQPEEDHSADRREG